VTNPDLTVDDVLAARTRIGSSIVRTPTLPSRTLSQITGADVWVKFEQLQFTASFKERGALNCLLSLDDDARRGGVVAASAGNHAQGVAFHAARLGIPATIVMPKGTPATKVQRTLHHGATVVLEGASFEEASAHARLLTERDGLEPIHPFDDPRVIAGQGTIGLEIGEDVPDLECVVVPVGGGGLISGIATAVKAGWPRVQVIGVQVEGYSWAARRAPVTTATSGPTVAEGIAVRRGGELTSRLVDALVDEVLVVSEESIETAVGLFLEIEKVVAEGAGATALAGLLQHRETFAGRRCALVLTGGNLDLRLLSTIALRVLERTGRVGRVAVTLDDRPGALARLTAVLAETGANVVQLDHVRHRAGLLAKQTRVEVEFETSAADGLLGALGALRNAGFSVEML
jgi:threonine dehydratase